MFGNAVATIHAGRDEDEDKDEDENKDEDEDEDGTRSHVTLMQKY